MVLKTPSTWKLHRECELILYLQLNQLEVQKSSFTEQMHFSDLIYQIPSKGFPDVQDDLLILPLVVSFVSAFKMHLLLYFELWTLPFGQFSS